MNAGTTALVLIGVNSQGPRNSTGQFSQSLHLEFLWLWCVKSAVG